VTIQQDGIIIIHIKSQNTSHHQQTQTTHAMIYEWVRGYWTAL